MTVAADVPCTKVASLVSNEDRAECFGREPIFSLSEGSPVCGIRNEVDHLSLRTDSLHSIDNDSEEAPVPDPQDALEVLEVLGPPLACLPKDIEIQELNAYRADYQNFRAGHASGARGEMASLCASVREQRLMDTCSGEASAGTYYKTFAKRRPRLVPLIGLDLATSSAVRSAATAASEHLEEMAQIHSAISGRAETSEDSGQELVEVTKKERSRKSSQADAKPTPCFANGTFGASRASKSRSRGPQLRQCSAPGPDQAFSLRQSWTTLIQKGAVPTTVAENDLEDPGAFQRSPRSNTSLGIGFLTHIALSMVCLMPFLHTQATPHSCLLLPTLYMGYVVGLWLRFGPCAKSERVPVVMTKVLRMERLVSEGSLPVWFPHLAAAAYVVMVGMLELGHRFQTVSKSQRMLSAGPVRHDYNCWGTGQEDVADCILVRHAGCTMTVSFYTCLIVMKVCNRKVKGSDLVGEHERSLQQLFPLEAPSLLSYVERSVKSNSTFWRSHRHYKAQSLILSLAWTLMSFYVYTELLQGAKTKSAQAVFCTALVFTFMLQYTLLRHVLLRVIVILEGVKARAAAMAFCDEEGVLPFTSAHSVYVWFSVRRNVQAQNEVAYQNASPVFTAMLICAAVCSGWVISQLRQRGMSVFGLTSRGGASLMVVASALVSCIFVGVFLRTLLEIGKLEDAHVRQLRMAHLRLEHAKCLKKASAMETETGAFVERQPSKKRVSRDLPTERGDEHDMDGAMIMIDRVISLLEQNDVKPAIFGVEIGSKSFQGVYAALLANLWYLLVWGVLIPIINYHDD